MKYIPLHLKALKRSSVKVSPASWKCSARRASMLPAMFSGMLPAGTGTLTRSQLGYQHYRQEEPNPATAPT